MDQLIFDNLNAADLINDKVAAMIRAGTISIDTKTGKIHFNASANIDTPWLFIKHPTHNDCIVWKNIYYGCYGLLPIGCTGCWKVVAIPRTLDELFKLRNVMRDLNFPSKLGIEVRDYVPRLYGAYFYCQSKELGLATRDAVRKAVHENISPDIKVYLKRGCTEMEMRFGSSDKWEEKIHDGQQNLEDYYNQWYVEPDDPIVPPYLKCHIMKSWIAYAHMMGDETYKLYTKDGRHLYDPAKEYD